LHARKSEKELVADVEDRLAQRFTDLPRDLVSDAVITAHTRFEHSIIRDFVPLLVERRVRSELEQQLGTAQLATT